jgi:hypothetical protein
MSSNRQGQGLPDLGRSQAGVERRKAYHPPRLQCYGSVAKLTQSGNGTGTDGGATAGMRMQCL